MRALQQGFLWSAILAASCFFTVNASADFCTDFENYQGLPGGFPLTGQFGWYLPAGSVTFNVYTYFTGNPLGIPDNLEGGLFFVGGRGPGGGTFGRAQHDVTLSNTTWAWETDFCANFNGVAAVNNVGSLSSQPGPANDFILLCSWFPGSEGTRIQLGMIHYDAGGTQTAQPGDFASPAWQNLPVRNWYRLTTKVNYATNLITEVSIRDITGGGAAQVTNPVGWYLEGGAGGSTTPQTAFRFFAGGSNEGCITAWDNVCLHELGTTAVEASTWGSIKAHFEAPAPGSGKVAPQVANPEVQ